MRQSVVGRADKVQKNNRNYWKAILNLRGSARDKEIQMKKGGRL